MLDLASAEEAIALVPRATPKNVFQEIQRLTELYARGGCLRPSFVYDPPPDLKDVRRGLDDLVRTAASRGRLGAMEAARAAELELEARLVEHIGSADFAPLAGRRFRAPPASLSARVDEFVREALDDPGLAADEEGTLFASDDDASSDSLFHRVRRRAAELGLAIRVERRPGQLAVAATGHGVVAIRPGVMLSRSAASRIALHELLGHALPRHRATRGRLPLLRAGTAGSVEHEEGRALLVEARADLFDARRRRELALRHLAAGSVRKGAEFEETVRELVQRGASPAHAVAIGARVYRGGGLARELVYLPAYFEVRDAFALDGSLERWFELGRVGLEAARELSAATDAGAPVALQPSNSISTGA